MGTDPAPRFRDYPLCLTERRRRWKSVSKRHSQRDPHMLDVLDTGLPFSLSQPQATILVRCGCRPNLLGVASSRLGPLGCHSAARAHRPKHSTIVLTHTPSSSFRPRVGGLDRRGSAGRSKCPVCLCTSRNTKVGLFGCRRKSLRNRPNGCEPFSKRARADPQGGRVPSSKAVRVRDTGCAVASRGADARDGGSPLVSSFVPAARLIDPGHTG